MRPLKLELAGFTSFREPTTIDFEDADYFAFVGPTGSGKSTVIDAMCFALYGSVPRYEDKRLVAPVITQGLLEARVRFDFELDGITYTAVRVVRRAGKGATTKEARLERDGEVLAGTADELSRQITDLVGLSFEHFTKCVVLPQGEFARFLHDKPADRQDMVVRLLHLDIYGKIRNAAYNRASTAKSWIAVQSDRLQQSSELATPERLREAESRLQEVTALRELVDELEPVIRKLDKDVDAVRSEEQSLSISIRALQEVTVPPDAVTVAGAAAAAKNDLKAAAESLRQAQEEVTARNAACAKLGERDPLAEAKRAHEQRALVELRLQEAHMEHEAVTVEEKRIAGALAAAHKEHEEAVAADRRARDEHSALHLAKSLTKGQPCPVCRQKVDKLPRRPKVPALDASEAAIAAARSALDECAREHSDSRQRLAAAARAETLLKEQLAELDAKLEDHPDSARVNAELASIDVATRSLEQARTDEQGARARVAEIEQRRDRLAAAEEEAWKQLDETRDALAALSPPPPDRSDLSDAWSALVAWSKSKTNELGRQQERIEKRRRELSSEQDTVLDKIRLSCEGCAVVVSDGRVLDAVVSALASARHEVEFIHRAVEEAEQIEKGLEARRIEQTVADELALHLSAKAGRFESWLVDEALRRLVEGATSILMELSGGQYSMSLDGSGGFSVVDHHNAGEVRSARTLSGGETFLASLSLALALSDHLAELAAAGAAKLEAIFLDEGFGTLDPETLDTVAATVENLAASGRVVGIVTHVRDLAERVPLQFQVRKDVRTSTIERIAV